MTKCGQSEALWILSGCTVQGCCMLVENQSLHASYASLCGDLESGVGQILNATQVMFYFDDLFSQFIIF